MGTRQLAFVLGLCAVHAATEPAEVAPMTPEEYAGYEYAAELARDLLAFMDEEGVSYAVDEEYPSRWAIPFEGDNGDWYVVVSVDPEYVVFVIEVFDIPDAVDSSFYSWLLDKNFDINQAKFGTDEGKLYFNVDAPTRLLDRREYLDTIRAMVNFVDGIYPEIAER
jgi:hypothetical protein